MKKFNVLLLFVMGLALNLLSSCQKEKIGSNDQISNLQTSSIIEDINNYRPETEEIASLYHGFLKRINAIRENNQSYLKGDPNYPDTTIDVGIWQIETGLNNEFGFKNDSIAYERQDEKYYILDIIDFDENQVPIVPGEQLDSVYLDMENYIEESALVDSLFWMCVAKLEYINQNTLTISILPYRGMIIRLRGVLPPGTDPEQFPEGTIIGACIYIDYGIAPLFKEIEWRISNNTFFNIQPDYIFVYDGFVHNSWYINLYNHDERFWAGSSENELVYTDECNYYLNAQKEIVDSYNPYPNDPNRIIGTFDMHYFEAPFPVQMMNYWHTSEAYIFEIVFVGPGSQN